MDLLERLVEGNQIDTKDDVAVWLKAQHGQAGNDAVNLTDKYTVDGNEGFIAFWPDVP